MPNDDNSEGGAQLNNLYFRKDNNLYCDGKKVLSEPNMPPEVKHVFEIKLFGISIFRIYFTREKVVDKE